MGGDGAVTTAIASGGANTPTAKTSKCETFNGTSWTEQGNMNTRNIMVVLMLELQQQD